MSGQVQIANVHEAHVANVRTQSGQCVFRNGSLKCDQTSAFKQDLDLATGGKVRLKMGNVVVAPCSVDDEKEFPRSFCEHEIIQDPARLVCQKPVALPVVGQTENVDGRKGFQSEAEIVKADPVRPDDDLAHMADVEQARRFPRVEMFTQNTILVLNRQRVSGELDHLRAMREMKLVKRCMLDF